MILKRLYLRFRDWQRNPRRYPELDNETHCCNNCGQEYAGSFCPRCGQRASAGRITWDVARRSVMDVWGLGGRSFPYSVWQLLWRPGYFINDYINGKWQSSFAPVKMLVLVTVIIYFMGKAIFPEYWETLLDNDSSAITSTGLQYYFDYVFEWIGNHLEWMLLFILSLIILPTWLVFRHSPRNSRHTLPQGFFIQVFSTTQLVLWLFIISLCVKLSGVNLAHVKGGSSPENQVYESVFLLMPFIVLINYKQLFGYGWWGTVWRVSLVLFASIASISAIFLLSPNSTNDFSAEVDGDDFILRMAAVFLLLFIGLLLSMADLINRKLWRERGWLRAMVVPLCIIVMMVGIGIFIGFL